MRYADPDLCPDCRSDLPDGAPACPTCALPVRHAIAVELFATLSRGDALLAQLRAIADRSAAPAAAAAPFPVSPAPVTAPTIPPPPGPPGSPLPAPAVGRAGGIATAAIPKILLGLGALCLLVAAIVFLAVSWNLLGVGGRTAVLLTLTAAAAGAALLLNKVRLRIAGESMSVVALGMLGLDVLGADAAGWFGDSTNGWALVATGAVMALGGTAMALPRFGDAPRLVTPQIFVGVGYAVAWAGLVDAVDHELMVGHVVVVLGAVITWLSRSTLPVRAWSVGVATGLVWCVTTVLALGYALGEPTVATLWVDGAGWSLLVSAATVLAPGLVSRRRDLTLGGGSLGALLVTAALCAPAVDESARTAGAVALLATATWVAAYALLPAAARVLALAPAAAGSLILLAFDVVAGVTALVRIADLETDSRFGVALHHPDAITEPLLTVPSALVPIALLALLVRRPGHPVGRTWWQAGAVVAGVAAVVTIASYDVALTTVVGALALVAIGSLVLGLAATGSRQTAFGLVGLGLAAFGVLLALPSTAVVAVASGIVLGLALIAHFLGRTPLLCGVAAAVVSPALAVFVWTVGVAGDVDAERLGIPLLVLLGALAIARPRLEVELPAALVALVAVPPAVLAATDEASSLALHLVVVGALLVGSALVNPARRELVWVAVPVFALSSWVWFGGRGIDAPEPYTLPVAVALTVLGLLHLRRNPDTGTETALLPGLLLGALPSMIWVLGDPLSARALALGAACLALTILGAALRWSAPLMVGAAVGAIVVIREIGPYAGEVPQWVWIGLAGALLTTIGITWERRLLEIRNAVGMLGRLR